MSRVLAASATQCCYLVLSDGGLAWFPGLMLDKATLQTVVGDPAFRLFFGPNFAWLFERTTSSVIHICFRKFSGCFRPNTPMTRNYPLHITFKTR